MSIFESVLPHGADKGWIYNIEYMQQIQSEERLLSSPCLEDIETIVFRVDEEVARSYKQRLAEAITEQERLARRCTELWYALDKYGVHTIDGKSTCATYTDDFSGTSGEPCSCGLMTALSPHEHNQTQTNGGMEG